MLCPWRTSDLGLLLLFTVFSVAASANSCMDGKQMTENNSSALTEVNILESVPMGTRAVLCCPPVLLAKVMLMTWKITLRGQSLCTRAHKKETNKTIDTNCTDGRITWASRPDLSPDLQINEVAVTHDGIYICETATFNGNFYNVYQLQVLVPPEANIFFSENKTLVVCETAAGKPAAQISWTPEGHCVTKDEENSDGTVMVRSTCSYSDSNVSTVTCLVSHLTGNRSLSQGLPSGNVSLKNQQLLLSLRRMKCSPMLATQRRTTHSMKLQARFRCFKYHKVKLMA
ncbi:cell surface glycoprotein CD200 receptor 1 isoform X2 [Heterocephalus glaber]|uniref:Cell surface glycoprotein CD200 receptor 1 isoform X2 n=1 Tax=Heterocephalus glaber TaxID=10181 RepID=A0AAX6TFF5_HETGA|nr:cell surface glycoprotein CD200 receptor 1 isoform X2 [Heterocephalus glaber]